MLKWRIGSRTALSVLSLSIASLAAAQGNSPYSRYGLGDLVPHSNMTTRGMGGISAGYADVVSVNFSNPASYSQFSAKKETKTNKIEYGRVVLDGGITLGRRTLIAPNTTTNFSAPDAYFSYVQLGIPLRRGWGLSVGIRPLSRINYKIDRTEVLKDPTTGQNIENSLTRFEGTGGSFMPTIGTGFSIGQNLSVGINAGYLFGRKELSTRRALLNDSVEYYGSQHRTEYTFGDFFFNPGIQYHILDTATGRSLRFGVAGNWTQSLKGSYDINRQTYTIGSSGEILQIDSVFNQSNITGNVTIPASYTAGFVYSKTARDGKGFLFGVDYTKSMWADYRFFGQSDSTRNSWAIKVGGQINPRPQENYFSRVTYRAGITIGQDYVAVKNTVPVFGASLGMALPIRTSRLAPNQYNAINISFEFVNRGNNENLLKENIYRFSVGFNFTDLWFVKRKYE